MAKTEKVCRKCGELKPITGFSLSRQGVNGPVYRSDCKACCSTRALEWQDANRQRQADTQFAWNLMRNYGITKEEYDRILAEQGGVCGICGKDDPNQKLSVDHNHETGKVRGLLCSTCNRGIGLLNDDVDVLKRAIYYLERI